MDNVPDEILRVKIDKLAGFVAKNGEEFELLVIQKQKNNPEFLFLTGGPYFQYYKEKVLQYSTKNSTQCLVKSSDSSSLCLPSITNEVCDFINNSFNFFL
uniref:Calcium homeostasis endoplasmic reticulum protein (Trinotate prediction) n=1 Tax=Myxobolus squamalis TaxID=59785 RepID=A0A6B2G7Y6_MYXSQ